MWAQVALEVPVLHELHDDQRGLTPGNHAQQTDDVERVEGLHHGGLVQELDALTEKKYIGLWTIRIVWTIFLLR